MTHTAQSMCDGKGVMNADGVTEVRWTCPALDWVGQRTFIESRNFTTSDTGVGD